MQQFRVLTGLWVTLFACSTALPHTALANLRRPKLVLLLVIDQFRADYLSRYRDEFLPRVLKDGSKGGFAYLMASGAYFPLAQYDLLQNITSPGHATIASGSYPYRAGIPMNEWWDTAQQKMVYCVEDSSSPIVEGGKTSGKGMSPRNLIGSTVGDELKNADYPSRVVAVALKDRASILLGGKRADLALWYDFKAGRWVSSRYYLKQQELPGWMKKLSPQIPMTQEVAASAKGAEYTVEAAEGAIDAFQLGRGKATDLLAVSFSGHDMVGHTHGPNSAEIKEVTLTEDRMISRLLNRIHKKVPGGLQNVTIVLTADHGVAPSPVWATEQGLEAGVIDGRALVEKLSAHLDEKFGAPAPTSSGPTSSEIDKRWISAFAAFNFYLNRPMISQRKLDLATVESAAKQFLLQMPVISYVLTSTDYEARKLPPGIWEHQAIHSYIPGKSGDLLLIPRPYFIPKDPTYLGSGYSTHVTGYSYDRTVPILLSGMNIIPGTYATHAEPIDIAPTLAFLLGTLPPALAEGRILSEILTTTRK